MRRASPLLGLLLVVVFHGCACHETSLLRRVPIPEVKSPDLLFPDEQGSAGSGPDAGVGEDVEDCLAQPQDPRCLAGEGVYVCNSCPGASDANPGTPTQPLLTMGAGLLQAQERSLATVYVANRSVEEANTYAEDLTLVEGISLKGRFVPGAVWTRSSAVRTRVQASRPEGLTIPAGITRGTSLEGFEVRGAGGGAESVAISILESSPSLVDVAAVGVPDGSQVPARSIGIRVQGTDVRRALPLLAGRSLAERATVHGGPALEAAVGLDVRFGHVEAQFLEVAGGTSGAAGVATGVRLVDSAGRLRDSLITGGNAGECIGFEARGSLDGLRLEGSWVTGCDGSGAVPATRGVGVLFDQCTPGAAELLPVVRGNASLTGGLVPSGLAVGLAALDGCDVQVLDNPNVSGGSQATRAVGLLCSYRSWSGADGRDSACVVRGNAVMGGLTATVLTAVGIQCEGSCGSQGQECVGSCAELSQNEASGTAGVDLTHVLVTQSSPLIRRNRIGLGGAGVACIHRTTVQGLVLQGSASRVENNFVVGGPCEQVSALVQRNEQRTGDGSWVGPDVHSNTIVGAGSSANTTGSTSYGVVVGTPSLLAAPPLGSYRNNVVVGGQNNHRAAFVELDAFADPLVLRNNAFSNLPRASGPNPLVYVDEDSSNLLTAGDINGLSQAGTAGNVDGDPLFINSFFDFHLQPLSPLRGLGTPEGAPTEDIDGDPRPSPARTRPDIGADELPL